jgi:hypothetical protein
MSRKSCVAGVVLGTLLTTTLFTMTGTRSMADDTKAEPKLVHNVFFTLKDGSPANIQKLTDACHKYITGHEGEVYFGAGTVVAELDRPVNQRDFHVALCVVFKNKAAHDTYQTHPRHLEFINENKETWASVRVFDSWAR